MHRNGILVLLVFTCASVSASADESFEVKKTPNLAYYAGQDADSVRHKLDLYVPRGKRKAPVLIFIHGGGWTSGTKNLYGYLASSFARQGILTVTINYRLSPTVKHPAHIVDTARAFAWVHKYIAKLGGDPENIFVAGHSAGGHLCSLLAVDSKYLAAHKLSPGNIRGVMPISGVFEIAGRYFDRSFPPLNRKAASPLYKLGAGKQAPFLVIYGEHEGGLGRQARTFAGKLKQIKSPVELLEVKRRNHFTIIMFAAGQSDPVNRAMVNFITSNQKKPDDAGNGKAPQ